MISSKQVSSAILFVAISLATQAALFSPQATAKNFWNQKEVLAKRMPCIQTSLIRVKKSDNLWSVLEDEEVHELMKEVMGSDTERYYASTQITELPDVQGDDIFAVGGVRGLFTITESFFDLNMRTKKLCICILSDDTISVYGVDSMEKLPEPVRDYIADVQSRIRGNDPMLARSSRGARICFAKANNSAAQQVTAKATERKNLNFGKLTGSYSRVDTEPRFEGADFRVSRLSGGKISFACQALNGTHTGEASGVVPIKNNVAVYDNNFGGEEGYRLIMRFDGKYVYVDQIGEGFGGIGVTAAGTYQKVDDQDPRILQN